ncbi:hypothetical protein [Nostoc sp.]
MLPKNHFVYSTRGRYLGSPTLRGYAIALLGSSHPLEKLEMRVCK